MSYNNNYKNNFPGERMILNVFVKSMKKKVSQKGNPYLEYTFEEIKSYIFSMTNFGKKKDPTFTSQEYILYDFACEQTFIPGVCYDLNVSNKFIKSATKSSTALPKRENAIFDIMLMTGIYFKKAEKIYVSLGDSYSELLMGTDSIKVGGLKNIGNIRDIYRSTKVDISGFKEEISNLLKLGIREDKINAVFKENFNEDLENEKNKVDSTFKNNVLHFVKKRRNALVIIQKLLSKEWYKTLIENLNYDFLEADKLTKTSKPDKLSQPERIVFCALDLLDKNQDSGNTYLDYESLIKQIFEIVNIKYNMKKINLLISGGSNTYVCDETNQEIILSDEQLDRIKMLSENSASIYSLYLSNETIKSYLNENTYDVNSEEDYKYLEDARLCSKTEFITNNKYNFYKKDTFFDEYINGYMIRSCNKKKSVITKDINKFINEYCESRKITLEDRQREAVLKFNEFRNGFFVLNGMAGTGKTFTVRAIIDIAKTINKNLNVKFIAPTGKAAKVLKNSLYANGEGFITNVS
ncbi:MAG: AAA family ATPase, partial [Peptostreptococcaceae bacterium]